MLRILDPKGYKPSGCKISDKFPMQTFMPYESHANDAFIRGGVVKSCGLFSTN